ncbi:uncharacterized protein BBA_09327 [Beauveria bassiana ARSEF 2860]|uniref:Uncharacterized protein n=1 Tax=Beauveria bassiana (strain ARSEF 2860) TaxID=655819 RepID=J5JCX2_BEAB2|nr:uncharacterized protein BBA_09327 [Beauveria bassiana ARSEF 2860]EJP61686.1 hypothetical protein BBA_09327 [Beauveria bassiana ARSEF 2860]
MNYICIEILHYNSRVYVVGVYTYSAVPANFVTAPALIARLAVFDEIFHGVRAGQGPGAVSLAEQRVIDLPHDKPGSMALFLFAMHSQFDHVPAYLPTDALYELTVVAHKYGATAVSRPWTAKWTWAVAVELKGEDDKTAQGHE